MITARNVEKLVQIGKMQGNINVTGSFNQIFVNAGENLLEQALRPSFRPKEDLTDTILKIINKFRADEMLHISTCIEISFLLLVHPEPKIPMDIMFSRRPKADINTFLFLLPVFRGKESEMMFLRELGIDSNERFADLFAITALHIRKVVKVVIDTNIVNRLADELLEAASKGRLYGDAFIRANPNALSLQVDGCLANMGIAAFMNKDIRAVTFFMGVRESMSQLRHNN